MAIRPPVRLLAIPSAFWLRAELATQRKRRPFIFLSLEAFMGTPAYSTRSPEPISGPCPAPAGGEIIPGGAPRARPAKQVVHDGAWEGRLDLGPRGKVAMVGGASRGLGFACAAELAKEGARISLCSRNAGEAEEAARRIASETGSEVHGFGFDLSAPAAPAE